GVPPLRRTSIDGTRTIRASAIPSNVGAARPPRLLRRRFAIGAPRASSKSTHLEDPVSTISVSQGESGAVDRLETRASITILLSPTSRNGTATARELRATASRLRDQ